MKELESINYLDLFAIPDLCDKNFFIPDYQRGYRWGETQIRQLLEDLCLFFETKDKTKGTFYCLQPIVVKKMSQEEVDNNDLFAEEDNNTWYEVIDGQQRLTTIRIILALENLLDDDKDLKFNLYYQTRPNLGKIFNNGSMKKKRDENKHYSIIADVEENIDQWHIIQAANLIIDWFQNNDTISHFKGSFYEYFSKKKGEDKSVQVIWYELKEKKSDPNEVFKRINDKKISLNNAELIRGMFLSDAAKYRSDKQLLEQFDDEITRSIFEKQEQERKQSHIIETWDVIESQLRNDRFWAFIKDDNDSTKYSCRIEYIFDLISQKGDNERDTLYTYLEFEKMIKSDKHQDLWNLWMKVETYYSLLKAWFENRFYYHKIGYLVSEGGEKMLIDLLSKSSELSKSQFKALINERISDSIHDKRKKGNKDILDYSYDEDYDLLKRTLFLYNVESTLLLNGEWFPFEKYKNEKNWTLEHIHAQNSEGIDRSDKAKWVEWFDENIKALERHSHRFDSNEELSSLLNKLRVEKSKIESDTAKYSFDKFNIVFEDVQRYFNNQGKEGGDPDMMHGISNMALLSGATNSSISNSVFEVKRQMIINADANGQYIPICTRRVFLKYYNRKEDDFTVQQLFYWSRKDRENYENDIKTVLADYMNSKSETNKIESEEVDG